jgi:hypothetical protein
MTVTWKPENASPELEEEMEAKGLPESDRDELRRFSEILRRRKGTPKGQPVPLTEEMRRWLKGDE